MMFLYLDLMMILCTWPGNFRSDSGAFWQSAAPRMAGNTYRLRAKAAREAGYRLGSDRGSPNQGRTLASKRVMARIWPPARVRTQKPVAWRVPAGPRR
jgi:hypothetical protein